MIYCFMVVGQPVSDRISNVLFQLARQMVRDRKEGLRIASDFVEGYVSTEGKTVVVGSLVGISFRAEIAWDGGTTNVKYVVATRDLQSDLHIKRWDRAQ